MTDLEIKSEVQQMYRRIVDAEERLKELREICMHNDTSYGNYQLRVGLMVKAEICEICGELIKIL